MRTRLLRIALTLCAAGTTLLLSCAEQRREQPQSSPTATPIPSLLGETRFERVALFPVYRNKEEGPTAAEIVALTPDGLTAVYADSLGKGLGFVDLTHASAPAPLGWLALKGEPTAVVVHRELAVVSCDLGENRGSLEVVDLATRSLLKSFPLPGQPDSLARSPDGNFLAVVIENEARDGFPESPPGSVVVVRVNGEPTDWTFQNVDLTGLAEVHPEDPEPEYVAINKDNIAAVTLQENNHIVLVDLEKGRVSKSFSAGQQSLSGVDLEKDHRITLLTPGPTVPREPDSITWCSAGLATADEGDWEGGGRGFTLYSPEGQVLYNSGVLTEALALSRGQYPEHRSEARGSEPESILAARFGDEELLFVGCERSNLVHVFRLEGSKVRFLQSLYSATGPESIAAHPQRGLLVLGSEVDRPKKGLRSHLAIYQRSSRSDPNHIRSSGIPWTALSALAAESPKTLFTLSDKALQPSAILRLDITEEGPLISEAIPLLRPTGEPVAYDLEGLSLSADGGYWLVAEGKKKTPSSLLRVTKSGVLAQEVSLPQEVRARLKKHGMEGVAEIDGLVYVAFQSAWVDDPEGTGRLGCYNPKNQEWSFAKYPLAPEHYLSGLSPGPGGTLAVLERDKFAREEARHKIVSLVDLETFHQASLSKRPFLDLRVEYAKRKLPTMEKVEGLAFDGRSFWIVNDNDGAKNSYGETVLLKVDAPPLSK